MLRVPAWGSAWHPPRGKIYVFLVEFEDAVKLSADIFYFFFSRGVDSPQLLLSHLESKIKKLKFGFIDVKKKRWISRDRRIYLCTLSIVARR